MHCPYTPVTYENIEEVRLMSLVTPWVRVGSIKIEPRSFKVRLYTEVSDQLHAALLPGKNAIARWIGGWVGPRVVMDVLENGKISFLINELQIIF
jgi:hypothetical protein